MSIGNRSGASAPKLAQQQDSSGQSQTGQQPATNNKSNTGGDKTQISLIPDATAIVASGTEAQTERDQQRADADLQAQQDMAFYALLMFIATVATVVITGFGVWLVKRTLSATLQAVEDTGKATEAMLEANKIARNQTRAFVRIDLASGAVIRPDQPIRINCLIQNYGQTPAFDFWCSNAICIRPAGWKWEDDPQSGITFGERGSSVLHPGDTRELAVEIAQPVSRDLWARIAQSQSVVFANVQAHYRTTYGAECVTTLSIEFHGQDCIDRGAPKIALSGNTAT